LLLPLPLPLQVVHCGDNGLSSVPRMRSGDSATSG
jgi:hypothetical protein